MKTTLHNFLKGLLRAIFLCYITVACLIDLYAQAPVVDFTGPSNGETLVSITRDLFIVFEDEIELGAGTFEVRDYNTESVVITINHGSPNLLLNKHNSENFNTLVFKHFFDYVLNYNTQYYITISSGLVKSKSGTDYPGFTNKAVWNFTTTGPSSIFSVNHKSPGALIDPPGTFQIKVAGSQLLQKGSVGNLRLIDISNGSATLLSFNTSAPEVVVSNNLITVNLTTATVDLNEYVVQWDEGYFENTSGGLIEENNSMLLYFKVYKAVVPILPYGNESFWPHDLWGAWVQEDDYFNISFDRPVKKGSGKIRIYRHDNDQLIEEIDVVDDVEKIYTKEELLIASVDIYPSTIFTPGLKYYVTWDAGVFTELSSSALPVAALTDKDYWTFTIDGEVPLDIVSLTPTNNSSIGHVLVLQMELNRAVTMDPDFIANVGLLATLKRYDNNSIVAYAYPEHVIINGATVSMKLSIDPPSGVQVYVEVTEDALKDENGVFFAGINNKDTWKFTSTWTGLTVQSLSPETSGEWGAANGPFTITLDNDFELTSSASVLIRSYPDNTIIEQIFYDSDQLVVDGASLSISPSQALNYGALYSIQVPYGLLRKSGNGEPYTGTVSNATWFFKIEPDPSLFALVSNFSPAHESIDVPVDTNIQITFTHPVSFGNGYVELRDRDTDTFLQSLFTLSNASIQGNVVTVSLDEPLPANTEIAVKVIGNAFISEDYNVIAINDNDTWYFTTASPDYPQYTALSPLNGADDVSANPVFEITFDRSMSAGIAAGSNFIVIRNENGTAFEFFYVTSEKVTGLGTNKLTMTPSSTFVHGASYYIEIPDQIIKDADDVHFQGITNNTTWAFTIQKQAQTIDFQSIADVDLASLTGNITLSATASSGLTVSFEVLSGAANLVNGNELEITGTGTVEVRAYQAGNNQYNSASVSQTFNVFDSTKEDQTITFESIADKTFGDADFDLTASASSGLPVSYTVTTGANLVSIDGNKVSILGAGSVTIRALQSGDDTYNPATPVSRSFTIAKANQNINITAISDKKTTDDPFDVQATVSSGLPLGYAVSGPASISGKTITLSGNAGTVTVTVSQAGNANYNAAEASTSFEVMDATVKSNQTITFAEIPDKTFGDAAFNLSASADSNLDVVFEVVDGESFVSLSGISVSILGAGSVSIKASQAGNDEYWEATPVTRTFEINKASQAITIEEIADKETTAAPFQITASVNSGLPLSYAVEGPASISGTTVTLSGTTGTVTITVSQAGNQNYLAASKSVSFEVFTAPVLQNQSITFAAIADVLISTGTLTLQASSSSGLPVSFEVLSGNVSLNGNVLTLQAEGTVSIKATQAGNASYHPAEPVTREFCVLPVKPVVTAQGQFLVTQLVLNSSSATGNQWLRNGSVISGATNQSLSITQAGNYSVRVTVNGCSNTSNAFEVTDVVTDISPGISLRGLEVFPNPARERVRVEAELKRAGNYRLSLMDMQGRVIKQMEYSGVSSISEWLELQGTAPGLYLIRLEAGAAFEMKRLVIANN